MLDFFCGCAIILGMRTYLKSNLVLLVPLLSFEEETLLRNQVVNLKTIGWLVSTFLVLLSLGLGFWTLILSPIPLFFFYKASALIKKIDNKADSYDDVKFFKTAGN